VFELFKRKSPHKEAGDPGRGSQDKTQIVDRAKMTAALFSESKFQAASCQSAGRERSHNEDTLFIFSSMLNGIDFPVSFGIYLVADGMGGHQNGEIASNLAAQTVSKALIEQYFEAHVYDRQSFTEEEIQEHIKAAVDEAQTLIKRRVPGGGTTLTLAMGFNETFYSAHIGDSRLYLVDLEGRLSLKTKDHSLVKRLVDLGEITENQAREHPQRNVLYRALGQVDTLEPDLDRFTLEKGEKLMLCSDGLWNVVEKEQMEKVLWDHKKIDQAAAALVHAANEGGGPDNISVVLVERIE
jgi:serine/threonine protein phosphatase PrpC